MNKSFKKLLSAIALGSLLLIPTATNKTYAKTTYTIKEMHKVTWRNIDGLKLQYDLDGDKKIENISYKSVNIDGGVGKGTITINNKVKVQWDDLGDGDRAAMFDLNKKDKYEEIAVMINPHQGGSKVDNIDGAVTMIKIFRYDGKSIRCLYTVPIILNEKHKDEFYINNNSVFSTLIPSEVYYCEKNGGSSLNNNSNKVYDNNCLIDGGKGYSIRKFYKLNSKTGKIEILK